MDTKGTPPNVQGKAGLRILLFVYGTQSLQSGSLFCLLLPDMTKESFCVFTRHFCRYLDEVYGTHSEARKKVLLIMDGAGSHQQKSCPQTHFHVQKLPPASPELNPVERFFEELRKDLAGHIFQTLEQAEEHLMKILEKYYQHPDVIIQLTQYPYIRLAT